MAESTEKMGVQNPESLHNLSKSTKSPTKGSFVNPGTPASPLVSMSDRNTGKLGSEANSRLRKNLIK